MTELAKPPVMRALAYPPPERVWEQSGNTITNRGGDPTPLWRSRPWNPGEKEEYIKRNMYEVRS